MPRGLWRKRKAARLGIFADVQEGSYVTTPWGTIGFLERITKDAGLVCIKPGHKLIIELKFLREAKSDPALSWLDSRGEE